MVDKATELNWVDKVHLYDTVAKNHLDTDTKHMLLKNAVHPLEELRMVSTTGNAFEVQNKRPMTYEEYETLLLAAAQEYDSKFNVKRSIGSRSVPANSSCTVYNHAHQEVHTPSYPRSGNYCTHD